MKHYDLCIAGACASGLAAALSAAKNHPGIRIAVLEKLPRTGKKILVTGNGRCNLTNVNAVPGSYNNPAFAAPILEKYSPEKVIGFFGSLGLLTYTDSAGRVYPRSNTASSVLDSLRFAAEKYGIDIFTETPVTSAVKKDGEFIINNEFSSDKFIIATGGKASSPQGSDGSGYPLAKSFGHIITPLFPSLVPVNTKPDEVRGLKGVRAANVRLTFSAEDINASSEGELLFTENGISGICAMELASFAAKAVAKKIPAYIKVDFLPEMAEESLEKYLSDTARSKCGEPIDSFLTGILPKPLGIAVLKKAQVYLGGSQVEEISAGMAKAIAKEIKEFTLTVTGTKGFENAQVTKGGVDTSDINPETMESLLVPGLYFCGEINDIDGLCGGFNLQWAFASGLLAGELG
ncbi:MAG: aminoacetone oxidase family FAD-binding enzyme [Clostridia bacterium]|nr:aminoacetone oxidase family FAD-binding enzyme [Clostridia bacterium]